MASLAPGRTRETTDNPWRLSDALPGRFPGLAQHFLDLVAARPTPQERDALIAAGYFLFRLSLADAVRGVERRVLARLAAAS